MDDFIGRLTAKLEELGIAEDTIVILTSDNGCSIVVDPERLKGLGHNPSYIFRGLKADIWEGGHRIPLIVRWPGHIAPGTVCDQTVCLTDLFATIAEITGYEYGDDAGEDSVSNLCLWMGEDRKVRDAVVHHSRNGFYSIRKDNWKLEFCAGSGGISFPQEKPEDTAGLLPMQLYDLDSDIGEQHNLLEEYPEKVEELRSLMLSYIVKGRSTPGEEQKNFPAPGKWPGLGWMNI